MLEPGWYVLPNGEPAKQVNLETIQTQTSRVPIADAHAAPAWVPRAGEHPTPFLILFFDNENSHSRRPEQAGASDVPAHPRESADHVQTHTDR